MEYSVWVMCLHTVFKFRGFIVWEDAAVYSFFSLRQREYSLYTNFVDELHVYYERGKYDSTTLYKFIG